VLWSVDNPGVADFPQTRVDSEDCTTPPATCEGDQRFQRDYYWIRDADDEQYLAGLQHLNSPADDARLEPHNYSMIDVPAKTGEDCEPTPEPTCETDPTLCPVPPVDVCPNVPGDQDTLPPFVLDGDGNCVLIPEEPVLPPEEPVLPPNKPEKPTKPAKPSAGPPTIQLTQAPAQPAQAAQAAQAVLPATGAPASLWLVLLGAGLVLGGVVLTRRSKA
jgi:LPXTG-motif cell wall-anchored protein